MREVPSRFKGAKGKTVTDDEIDSTNAKIIDEAVVATGIFVKKTIGGSPITQVEYKKFSREFERFINCAKINNGRDTRLRYISSEYLYQSLMDRNQEEAKVEEDVDYLMVILKQKQKEQADKWKSDFEHFLNINTVINDLLGVDSEYPFILGTSKHLRLDTNYDRVLNNNVFKFIDCVVKDFTIIQKKDKKFKGWSHIGSDEYYKDFRKYYTSIQHKLKSTAQRWLGDQIQEKKIQPFVLTDQFRIFVCELGKQLAQPNEGSLPCFDPCYTFSEFAVLPMMLAMHSGFIHFSWSDSNRDLRSVLITGPSTVGKSFFQDNYNKIYRGSFFNQKQEKGTQWFNAEAYAYNSWSIQEIRQDILYSDFMKRFADFNVELPTDQKGKDDVVVPANRQVIMAYNKDMSKDGFAQLFGKGRMPENFEADIFNPVISRMMVIYAQKPIDKYGISIQASEVAQLITSGHEVNKSNSDIQAQIFFVVTTYLFASNYKLFKNPEERATLLLLIPKFEETIFGFLVKHNLEDFVYVVGPRFINDNYLLYMDHFLQTQKLMQSKQKNQIFGEFLQLADDQFSRVFDTQEVYKNFIRKPVKERLEFYYSYKAEVKQQYRKYYHGKHDIDFDKVSPLYQQKINFLTQQ